MFKRRRYVLRSKKYILEKRKQIAQLWVYYFFILILVLTLLSLLSHLDVFRIQEVEIEGNDVLSEELLSDRVSSMLEGRRLGIFARSNILLLSRSHIAQVLYAENQRINDVSFNLEDLNTLVVEIQERNAFAVWCDTSESNCFFMDENALVFAQAPLFSGDIFFKYFGGGIEGSAIGKRYLPEDVFHSRLLFIDELRGLGLNPVSFAWKEDNDSEIILDQNQNGGLRGALWFNSDDPLSLVYEHLVLALGNEDLQVVDGEVLDVEYIDLRFGNKVFYKLK